MPKKRWLALVAAGLYTFVTATLPSAYRREEGRSNIARAPLQRSADAQGLAHFGSVGVPVFPVTSRKHGREYRLTRLITGVSWLHPTRLPKKDEAWASVARFRVTAQGKPAPFEPVGIAVTDGKGRKWVGVGYGNEKKGSDIEHEFLLDPVNGSGKQVRPDPRAWQLQVEFARTSGFFAEELWTVRSVPLAKRGQENGFNVIARATRQRAKVELRELVPPGGSLGEAIFGEQEKPCVSVVLNPRRKGLRLDLIGAVDDRSREIKTSLVMSGSGGCCINIPDPTERYHFSLEDLAVDASAVDLTFAVQETKFVQFHARPVAAKVSLRDYQADLKLFPRSAYWMPEWLHERLHLGAD
jgi:hypothetical protein